MERVQADWRWHEHRSPVKVGRCERVRGQGFQQERYFVNIVVGKQTRVLFAQFAENNEPRQINQKLLSLGLIDKPR